MKPCGLRSWNPKKKIAIQKTCWRGCFYSATLELGFAMEIWLGVTNEMCLQRLNLSSSQDSVFNYNLALLQHAMNAVGVCSPRERKHKHTGMNISQCIHSRVLSEQFSSCALSAKPAMTVSITMGPVIKVKQHRHFVHWIKSEEGKHSFLYQKSSSTAHI